VGKIVLWVDDEMEAFIALEYHLEDRGIKVVKAHDLKEAEQIIKDEAIDLLLFDVIVIPEAGQASFGRWRGVELAQWAINQGIVNLVSFSVLDEDTVRFEMDKMKEVPQGGARRKVRVFCKTSHSLVEVADAIDRILTGKE
jgi:hypothetical protein